MRYLLSLMTILLVCSCASKGFHEPQEISTKGYSTSRAYLGGMEQVWQAAKDAIEARNLSITLSSQEKGEMITDWASGKSDRLFSGYGETKIPYNIRFKFQVKFTQSGNQTNVMIRSREEYMTDIVTSGNDFNGSVYQWVPTDSSGFKEATLLDDISQRLKEDS